MIIHKKYVVPEYFDYIKNNQKTCYINLNIGSFSEMKKGDIIIWFYNNENVENMIKTQIVKIRKFKSFYNGIKNCRLKKIYPNFSNIQDAINLHINNDVISDFLMSKNYEIIKHTLSNGWSSEATKKPLG